MKNERNPGNTFRRYKEGTQYKESIGDRGIYEQSKVNERFFVGDQWYGVKCGNDRPLVRRNLIKRIGEYKLSAVTAAPIAVNYTADGIPQNTIDSRERKAQNDMIMNGQADFTGEADNVEISLIMQYLSDYFRITAERLKFDAIKTDAVRNAYISGTGLIYTYWDDSVRTGLYVDAARQNPIRGDIACEVIDVENVVFGDPNRFDLQSQPYIIIAQRLQCAEVRRMAKRYGCTADEIEQIKPNNENYFNAGTRGEQEPTDSKRVTLLTEFWKEYSSDGTCRVMAHQCTEKAEVRKEWNLGITMYPLAKMCWEKRKSCAYGDSEITYLIPNQIAINRVLSANTWSIVTTGMPITLVDDNGIQQEITNEPGQVIRYTGDPAYIGTAIHHVQPPAFSGQQLDSAAAMAEETMKDSGANDAALGNIRPDNATAIIQMREAALQPMQLYQNTFYDMIEDVARIWADFWFHLYGKRSIPVKTPNGIAYVPFDAKRYESLVVTARIDVGASTVWGTPAVVSTLDALLTAQIINPKQYLERMPSGLIPDKTGLINDLEQQEAAKADAALEQNAVLQQMQQQNPELYAQMMQLPPEEQNAMMQRAMASGSAEEEQI